MAESSISHLRQRMIDDMCLRKLHPHTQLGYIRAVKKLTQFLERGPDLASPENLRAFQKHLVGSGVSSQTINATICGLRFFFETTLDRPQALKRMAPMRVPEKLPRVLSIEEVTRLLEAAPNPKSKAALSVAYGAGLRASEVCHLKINDIDTCSNRNRSPGLSRQQASNNADQENGHFVCRRESGMVVLASQSISDVSIICQRNLCNLSNDLLSTIEAG